MQKKKRSHLIFLMVSLFVVLGFVICAQGQWGPAGGQQPQQQPQSHPYTQSPAPSQSWTPPSGSGQGFGDALGRFRINLPTGAVPVGATYNFNIPAAMCQFNIMTIAHDQTFQMQRQNFSNMLRQMGATIDAEQPMDVNGRPADFIAATMRDQNSGMSMHSMNAFISAGGLWVQVLGPENNVQQISQIFNSALSGLQF